MCFSMCFHDFFNKNPPIRKYISGYGVTICLYRIEVLVFPPPGKRHPSSEGNVCVRHN